MDEVDVVRPHGARSGRGVLAFVAALVGLTLIFIRERSGEVGLWDWDTYGRMHFIHHYRPDVWVDGHLMYHGVMRVVMAVGLSDLAAIQVITAASAAGFLCLLWWLCHREALSRAHTWLVLAAATIGSPGLVELFLIAEDNMLYLPVVLAVCGLLYLKHADRRDAIRRGVAVGVLIAAAMLINVSLLVMLGIIAAAPLLWVRDRTRALGVVVAGASALATYYLAHIVPFPGAKNALHQFLPQALELRDFAQSTTPLVSLARFEQYRGGLRAIGLAPSVHLMNAGPWLSTVLLGVLPKLVAGLWLALAVWLVRWRRTELLAGMRTRLDLVALVAIGLAFPYFYEPNLIERWDLFWVACLFALVPFFKLRPSRTAVALVVAIVTLQGVGTVVAIAHHYGVAWAQPQLAQARAMANDVRARNSKVVLLSADIDRLLLADIVFRSGPRTIYLLARDGACFRMLDLVEVPVELAEVQRVVAAAHASVYVDLAVSPSMLGALGLAPPPR